MPKRGRGYHGRSGAGHQGGHQADIRFRHLAAGVGQRHQAHVQRTLAHRRELRVGLHQGRAGIDRGFQRAAGPFLDFDRKLAAQAIAKITFCQRAAWELVGNLQPTGLLGKCGQGSKACGGER